MNMTKYVNRKLDELRDSLYSLKEYIPNKRDIASGIAGGLLLLTTACANSTPVQPVQTPTTPPVQPPAQTQTYTLQGTVYHDYNGDGIKEDNEPAIPGVEIDCYSGTSPIKSINTNANGIYSIQLDEKGAYTLSVDKNNVLGYNNQPFRYINISRAEFKKIADSLDIEANGDMNYDVALMQGFLTLLFGPNTKFEGNREFGLESYFDDDIRIGNTKNWKGGTGQTYDNHKGTDFYMEENTPILAAAPGVVVAFPSFEPGLGKTVAIQHESPYGTFYSLLTAYGHLNTVNVKVGDKVKRGDVIGLSGKIANPAFYSGKHLHFEIDLVISLSPFKWIYTDPYRHIFESTREIKEPILQSISEYGLTEKDFQTIINGYWIDDNRPHYP